MAEIAFLSFYSGVQDRGVENFAYEILKRLSKKHKITLFQAGNIIQNQNVRTYHLKAGAKNPKSTKGFLSKLYLDIQSLKILFFTLKAMPKLLKGKYQIIIPLNGGWQTVICKIVSIATKSKIIISGHAGIGADDAWNIFVHPDVFVGLTQTQTAWAKKLTSEVKIVTIPNGVDLAKFHPKASVKSVNLKKPIIVCASALVPHKNVDLTIRAVARAGFSLLLLGEGEDQGHIDALAKRLLKQNYLRLAVPYQEIQSYYRAGNVFTLASKNEAFGIVYLEAMACNLPVVATNDDPRAEIIGDAGILTDPQNVETYAKDLEIAAKTSYRNIPYNQALKFSWNKVSVSYDKLIKQVIKEGNYKS